MKYMHQEKLLPGEKQRGGGRSTSPSCGRRVWHGAQLCHTGQQCWVNTLPPTTSSLSSWSSSSPPTTSSLSSWSSSSKCKYELKVQPDPTGLWKHQTYAGATGPLSPRPSGDWSKCGKREWLKVIVVLSSFYWVIFNDSNLIRFAVDDQWSYHDDLMTSSSTSYNDL